MSTQRIAQLKSKIKAENLDGFIVNHLDYVRYLTGFTGSSGLLVVHPKGADFLTDFRYKDQASKQVKGARVTIVPGEPIAALKDQPKLNARNRKYGVDAEHLSIAARRRVERGLPDCLLVEADDLLADLGWIKDKSELQLIEKAVSISDAAFERVLAMVQPSVSERDICAELEYQMMALGSEKPAFETIIASGWRGALPHGIASDKKIKKGELVTFDFGATYKGYVSDITRTVCVGKASARQKKIYGIVLKAQLAGIKSVKAGVAGKAVDEVCRKIISKAGHGKDFGHGTGHGIGYFVHVGPRVSPLSKDTLRTGHVVTIEPGIYISGWGGVRIEDDVVVTRTSGKVLNRAPKNLLEL